MMDESEQRIVEWVKERRGWSADADFARGVMAELRREPEWGSHEVVPAWVPRPALSSFCLVAGITKVLLVMQVAF